MKTKKADQKMGPKAKQVIENCINELETKALPYLNVKSAILVEAAIMRLVEAYEFENDDNYNNISNNNKRNDHKL